MSAPACRQERRKDDVRARGSNGLDWLEVDDSQTELCVHFIGRIPEGLDVRHVLVRGGRRRPDVKVRAVSVRRSVDPEHDDCLIVQLDAPGDFSTYELCLVEVDDRGRRTGQPLPGLDPRYACLCFSFKAACATTLDCVPVERCAPERPPEPPGNYLAKDFESFRRLAYDRLAVTLPEWSERHVPDLGVALVELLSYEADRLSYFQDAVAGEAYLDSARRRISVRRHARLVDYRVHDGCNARAWLALQAGADVVLDTRGLFFTTRVAELPADRALEAHDYARVPRERYEVFEPLEPAANLRLRVAHNRISFWTWGQRFCCLPAGTTSATLRDEWAEDEPQPEPQSYPDPSPEPRPRTYGEARVKPEPKQAAYRKRRSDALAPARERRPNAHRAPDDEACETPQPARPRARRLDLRPGDFLLFEELLAPTTGSAADADPTHRHVVRVTAVEPGFDALYEQPIVEVEWAAADALPFALCLSALGPAPDCAELVDVSVARGNVLLSDHGETLGETLGPVPEEQSDAPCECVGRAGEVRPRPGRFRPHLNARPLTFAQPLMTLAPASSLLVQDAREALPRIVLSAAGDTWDARADLLDSEPGARHVAVEVDDDGFAHLRFGDGTAGRVPAAGATFEARYRVGNGPAGNVGAETIVHAVFRSGFVSDAITSLRNPLAASAGSAPEALDSVRLRAPHAFRRELRRAITADDYARLAEARPGVQRAAATLRWSGSWYEAEVGLDALGRSRPTADQIAAVTAALEPVRRIGHDLRVQPARQVPLLLELLVCVEAHSQRGPVEAALRARFGAGVQPDGTKGLFHPDNVTFGEPVSLSRLLAAAQAVEGVVAVQVLRLERLFEGPNGEVAAGLLPLGPLEIARLDNDPRAPEHGVLRLHLRGGR
jgi:hypothetical protein